MPIMFGTNMYGPVDRIPGLGYVKTKFFTLFSVPIFPLASYFILERSEKPTFGFYGLGFSIGERMSAIETPLNLRSVLLGYAQGVIFYVSLLLGFGVALLLYIWWDGKSTDGMLGIAAPVEICLILFLIAISRFNLASPKRQEEILSWLREQMAEKQAQG